MRKPEFNKLIKGNGNTYTLLVDEFIIRGIFDFGEDLNPHFEEEDVNNFNFNQEFLYESKIYNKKYIASFKLEPYQTLDSDEFLIIGSYNIKNPEYNDIIEASGLIDFKIFEITKEVNNSDQIIMIESVKKEYNLERILIEIFNH